jgi:hypothetical protein
MIGLFFSEALLFAATVVIGFAVGWKARMLGVEDRQSIVQHDIEQVRHALSEAQVRRARNS